MTAIELRGAELAKRINEELEKEVQTLAEQGKKLCLASLQVGHDDSSEIYRNSQAKKAAAIGIEYKKVDLPESSTEEEVLAALKELNDDDGVTGIILQTPLPGGINLNNCQNAISPKKDVDGVTSSNLGAVLSGRAGLYPSTALSAFELLKASGVDLIGKEAVVIGRSAIVAKPLTMMLINERVTVTVCHTGTSKAGKLDEHIANAEILIVATGQPEMVKASTVKDGAIVIDVGINYVNDKIVGDVEQNDFLREKVAYLTPVPGGVGPLTVTMLLKNCVLAAKKIQ